MFQITTANLTYLYVLILALLVNVTFIYWNGDEPIGANRNEDAVSAIRRAKSVSCKSELKEYANQIQELEQQQILKRRCHRDENLLEVDEVGYLEFNELNVANVSVVKLQEVVRDRIDCLETCFIYGHSYGGYYHSNEESHCFCGNTNSLTSMDNLRNYTTNGSFSWFRIDRGIFKSHTTICNSRIRQEQEQVKIAFILTLRGRSCLQVKRLLASIYSEFHIYYLHIDNQDDYLFEQLSPLELKYSNIILARSRFETIWGGPQLLTAILSAIEHLSSYDWNYVINLSESDFPVKPLSQLESYLQNKDCIFLRKHNLEGYNFIKKQGLDRSFYQCERRVWRLGRRKLPKGIIYSGGSDWFALPRSFSDYIVGNSKDRDGLVEPLLMLFNHTLLPAESFFHTLAINSEFCDKVVDNNLRVNNWKRKQGCKCQQRAVVDWCGCSPHIYRNSDIRRLKNLSESGDLFFTRKFDPTVSVSVINQLEQFVLNRKPNSIIDNAGNYWLNVYAKNLDRDSTTSDISVIQQFSLLASNQVNIPSAELEEVYLYFEDDSFKGLILEVCSEKQCHRTLVSMQSLVKSFDESHRICSSNLFPYQLLKLEIGHEFDSNERMFRNHGPLSIRSDLTIYHEWLVNDFSGSKSNVSELILQFQWFNLDRSVLVQDIKLKPDSARSRLSFAHRLDRKGPMDAGLWTLKVSHGATTCVEHEFLVFGEEEDEAIRQEDFNKLHGVLDHCIITDLSSDNSCLHQKWSAIEECSINDDLF